MRRLSAPARANPPRRRTSPAATARSLITSDCARTDDAGQTLRGRFPPRQSPMTGPWPRSETGGRRGAGPSEGLAIAWPTRPRGAPILTRRANERSWPRTLARASVQCENRARPNRPALRRPVGAILLKDHARLRGLRKPAGKTFAAGRLMWSCTAKSREKWRSSRSSIRRAIHRSGRPGSDDRPHPAASPPIPLTPHAAPPRWPRGSRWLTGRRGPGRSPRGG